MWSWSGKKSAESPQGGRKTTIFSANTMVRGEVYSQSDLVIEGEINGNIVGNQVLVKPRGRIHGSVTCRNLIIETGGVVDGEMRVANSQFLTTDE